MIKIQKKKEKGKEAKKKTLNKECLWVNIDFYFDLTFSLIIAAKSRSALQVAWIWLRIPWRPFFKASLLDAHNILRLIVAVSGALYTKK